jgi:hypothetical protein
MAASLPRSAPVAGHRERGGAGERPLLGQEDAGVADVLRVQALLDRAQHLHAERSDLALHPGPVVGADGMVMGQRAPGPQQRVGPGPLGGEPLLDG